MNSARRQCLIRQAPCFALRYSRWGRPAGSCAFDQAPVEGCEGRSPRAASHVQCIGKIEPGIERVQCSQHAAAVFDRDVLESTRPTQQRPVVRQQMRLTTLDDEVAKRLGGR